MDYVAEEKQGGDGGIARKELPEQLGLEVGEYLAEHIQRAVERRTCKEEPREANQVERQQDGEKAAHACGVILLIVS